MRRTCEPHLQEVGLGLVARELEAERAEVLPDVEAGAMVEDAAVGEQQHVVEQVIHLHTPCSCLRCWVTH